MHVHFWVSHCSDVLAFFSKRNGGIDALDARGCRGDTLVCRCGAFLFRAYARELGAVEVDFVQDEVGVVQEAA